MWHVIQTPSGQAIVKMGIKNWMNTEVKSIAATDTRINEAVLRKDLDNTKLSPR
jgi:hypothetical protein